MTFHFARAVRWIVSVDNIGDHTMRRTSQVESMWPKFSRRRGNARPSLECLESRLTLSTTITPIDNQQVIDSAAGSGQTTNMYLSRVAMEPNGDHVVVWDKGVADPAPPYYNDVILAQRYNAQDQPVGGQINVLDGLQSGYSAPIATRYYPSVAMDSNGDFIVAWYVNYNSGGVESDDLYAIRFHWDSSTDAVSVIPTGGSSLPFKVNQLSDNGNAAIQSVMYPEVAMDPNGDFDFTWTRFQPTTQYGNTVQVWARTYNNSGIPTTNETLIDETGGNARLSWIAMDSYGDCTISWAAYFVSTQGGAYRYNLYFQQFTPTLTPTTSKIMIGKSRGDAGSIGPQVSMDSAGDAAIVWANYYHLNGASGTEAGAFGRTYQVSGAKLSGVISIDDFHTLSGQNSAFGLSPSVSMDPSGNWVTAWSVPYSAYNSEAAIYAQTFDINGNPTGPAGFVAVSQPMQGGAPDPYNNYASVATNSLENGEFALSWDQYPYYGGSTSVLSRAFDAAQGSSPSVATPGTAFSVQTGPVAAPTGRSGTNRSSAPPTRVSPVLGAKPPMPILPRLGQSGRRGIWADSRIKIVDLPLT